MAHRARLSDSRHADRRSGTSGKRAARNGRRTEATFVIRPLRALASIGPFLLFGLALVTTGLVAALVAGHVAVGRAAVTGPQGTGAAPVAAGTVGTAGATSTTWIPLRSHAPGDILAAARQSPLFQAHRADDGDHEQDLSRLGAPVLVHAMQPPSSTSVYAWPDVYVLPILDAAGNTVAAAELELNPAHRAVHVTSIVTYAQPRPQGSIARQSSAGAVSALAARQHIALRPGTTPQLVYFPLDARFQNAGSGAWTAGGTFPADPAWLVMGADGLQRLVGTDGSVHLVSQLPVSQG